MHDERNGAGKRAVSCYLGILRKPNLLWHCSCSTGHNSARAGRSQALCTRLRCN